MYKCNDCGRVFDEPKEWRESRGEFWGMPCYERMIGCPYCYSFDFDEDQDEDEKDGDEDDDG